MAANVIKGTVTGGDCMVEEKGIKVGQAGFSIIEVMIGAAIFAFGIITVAGMQITGTGGTAVANQYTEASTIGMDKIEELIALPFNTYDSPPLDPALVDRDNDGGAGDKGLFDATAGTADNSEIDPSGRYTIYWNIADDDLSEFTKTVSVIVVWNGNGMQRSVSMQRVIPQII
jgi:Tfp pilus assembly protein PilV